MIGLLGGRAFELGGGEGDAGIGAAGGIAPTNAPSRLNPGQQMRAGNWLLSPNRQWALAMQTDGQIALYRQDDGRSYWDLGTQGRGYAFAMQTDGNLVVYNSSNQPLWATDTQGHAGAFLVLQDDANLVLYEGQTPLWHSDTVGAVWHHDSSLLADIASTFVDVVKVVAPLAQIALSFVPGVGTVVSGAIAAGIALANGQNITDALISGVAGSLPGGPITAAAFKAGIKVAKGENVGTAALNSARDLAIEQGGPVAAAAFDVAVSLATAQSIQNGEVSVVQFADEAAAPRALTAGSAQLGLNKLKVQSGTTSFAQRAATVQFDIVPTPKRIAKVTAKKAAIAVGGVSTLGAAVYFGWPLLSRALRGFA